MNVYDHISENNRKIALILCVFPVALFVTLYLFTLLSVSIGMVWLIEGFFYGHFVEESSLGLFDRLAESGRLRQAWRITWGVYPWVVAVAFIWIVISYFTGDAMILKSARAREITFGENSELFRLVENTAIMAGLPTPKIYIIEEDSLNAFATGCRPETASIALTRGIVEKLEKDELQAVIAHELAHIGNRDTRVMMIAIAGIGLFVFLGETLCHLNSGMEASDYSAHYEEMSGKQKVDLAIAGPVLLVIILIGSFFGLASLAFGYVVAPVIRLALSRRQEFQADATATKIVRDNDALARALEKIAPDSRVRSIDTCPLVGNICIAAPTRTWGLSSFENKLFATHPPIEDRITALKNMAGKNVRPPIPAGKVVW